MSENSAAYNEFMKKMGGEPKSRPSPLPGIGGAGNPMGMSQYSNFSG